MIDDTRKFEIELEIGADVERVWKALTESAELSNWFPLEANVKPGRGGEITLSWGADCLGTAPITGWDPPTFLQWTEQTSHPDDVQGTAPIVVAVHLEAVAGGRTRLRLVHSGMPSRDAWDGYFDSISRGWKFELRGLRHYLEHHAGTKREVLWIRAGSGRTAEEIAARVLGPEGRVLRGKLAGLAEGDAYELTTPAKELPKLSGEIRVNNLPRSFAATVGPLNNAYFRFEIENLGAGQEAWLWLSTYGVPELKRAEIEAAWKRALRDTLRE